MNKRFAQSFVIFVFILGFVVVGMRVARNTRITASAAHTKGSLAVAASTSVARDPAAIHRNYDFSQLDGAELDQASKQRLIGGATVVHDSDQIGVALGDFVLRGSDGQKNFACQKFGVIVLQFQGDGSAVNGRKPEMEVEGSCEVAGDINSISPLWIPVAKILGEPVADGEFDFREGHPVRVRFANLLHEWPTAWKLVGVHLVDPNNPQREVTISDRDLQKISAKPLIVSFQ
jgi:hypothetical protein